MTQYMLSVHTVEDEGLEPMTDEAMQDSYAQIGRLEEEMKAAGAGPDSASVVRASNGEVLTTDGPFIESKEQIGGFYIIQAEGLDAALEWASKTTAAVGMPIEVRPFLDSHGA